MAATNVTFTIFGPARSVFEALMANRDIPEEIVKLIVNEMKDREGTHDFAVSLNIYSSDTSSAVSYNVAASLKPPVPAKVEAVPAARADGR